MKKLIYLAIISILFCVNTINAQLIFQENFDYTSNQSLTSNGWLAVPGNNTNPVLCTSSGLSYSGYALSAIANAATLSQLSGQDVYKDAAISMNNGNVFASFMLKVDSARDGGDYFFALMNQMSTTNSYARVYVRESSAGYFKMGVSKNNEAAVYSNDSFIFSPTYLVVVKYQFATASDTVKLYVFDSGIPSTEPFRPTVLSSGSALQDATSLGRVALIQSTAARSPRVIIDGINASNNWPSLNTLLPLPVSSLNFNSTKINTATISWTKATNYSNSSSSQLIFVKQVSAIVKGMPNRNASTYNADTNFTGSGSKYQRDTLAKCVYNGDGNSVEISGLLPSTVYHVLAYRVDDADSAYSPGVTTSGSTKLNGPDSVMGMFFTSIDTSSFNINWNNPNTYVDSLHTTLVFVKQNSNISLGIPTIGANNYTGNSAFGLGSKYQNDTSARCVYKGNNESVTLTNLKPNTRYYVATYVVSIDSLYSYSAQANAYTKSVKPSPVTNVSLIGLSISAGRISWTKPTGYINANYTTLVFLKQNSSINSATPTQSALRYIANANFMGAGSIYEKDSMAKCMFNADTNYVNISGINNQSDFYAMVYVVVTQDSNYSNPSIAMGKALGVPAVYSIGQINKTNMTSGNPDSINVRATLRGVVHGFNMRAAPAIQFLLRDNTGGIYILQTNKAFGYIVTEGDSVEVQGTISTNRGLTIISGLDTILFLGNRKTIQTPISVNTLSESLEANMVVVNNLRFAITPTDSMWRAANYTCIRKGSNDTVMVRILSTSGLVNRLLPSTATFNLTGMVAQQSSSFFAPFAFNGYYLVPRSENDVTTIETMSAFQIQTPISNTTIIVNADTSSKVEFNWASTSVAFGFSNPTYIVKLDSANRDFTNPLLNFASNNSGLSETLTISHAQLRAILVGLGLKQGQTFNGKWLVTASTDGVSRNSENIFNIALTVGIGGVGINEITDNIILTLFPNPTKDVLNVVCSEETEYISVSDLQGRIVSEKKLSKQKQFSIETNSLSPAIYVVKIKTANGKELVSKLIIE